MTGNLLSLCLAATACASDSDASEPVAADEYVYSDASPDAGGVIDSDRPPVAADGPQYGDSFDDWQDASESASAPVNPAPSGFKALSWTDLIPPGFSSEQIVARYEDRLEAAEPGSAELDELYAEMNAEYEDASVNPQLNSVNIQLAGFVAPLAYDGDRITEFLLVPYFGACIHVPPPPVNQTVIVELADGDSLTFEESWGAIWVAGEMTVTSTNTSLATAGYSISGARFGVYEN